MCITDKQLWDLQEPDTVSGHVVDEDRSPVLFVQKVNTQMYLLPWAWCLPRDYVISLLLESLLTGWRLHTAVRAGALAGQAAGMCEFTCSVHLRVGGNYKDTVSELKITANPDRASSPTSASPAGALPGRPIDPRPCRKAFEILLPLHGPVPPAPVVSFPNPLHSNGFGIF